MIDDASRIDVGQGFTREAAALFEQALRRGDLAPSLLMRRIDDGACAVLPPDHLACWLRGQRGRAQFGPASIAMLLTAIKPMRSSMPNKRC